MQLLLIAVGKGMAEKGGGLGSKEDELANRLAYGVQLVHGSCHPLGHRLSGPRGQLERRQGLQAD